jgi:hypothetical protein
MTTMATSWQNIIHTCEHHAPDIIYVAIGCSQKRHEYGKHSPQECPPFVRQWVSATGAPARSICILIDPDLEDDLYVLFDLTDEELSRTRILTVRQEFHWSTSDVDRNFINSLCELALRSPNTYLIVQDYSGEDICRHYPIDMFGPSLIGKVVFDVRFANGGCWIDFDKIHLERDAETGAFLQPPFLPLAVAAPIAAPDTLQYILDQRFYTLVSCVFRYYKHPDPGSILNAKIKTVSVAYGVPVSVDLRVLAEIMIDDFATAAGVELSGVDITHMLDEPTEKVLPAAMSTLKLMITQTYIGSP